MHQMLKKTTLWIPDKLLTKTTNSSKPNKNKHVYTVHILENYIVNSFRSYKGSMYVEIICLIPDVCSCLVLRVLAVAVCKIGDVCCFLAPAPQPFSSNSLYLNAPEEACSRNVRASGTLKFGYEGVFKMPNKQMFPAYILNFTFNSACLRDLSLNQTANYL